MSNLPTSPQSDEGAKLGVVQWGSFAGSPEPYLSIPGHPGLRITPYRNIPAELQAMTDISNDPGIGKWSFSRPYPYVPADAQYYLSTLLDDHAAAVQALANGSTPATCPFSVLRTAEGEYVGDVGLCVDTAQRNPAGMIAGNEAWMLSYVVSSKLWGRGVGTGLILSVLAFAKSIGVKEAEALVQTDNVASTKLITKVGFRPERTYMQAWPEAKGGREREIVRWVKKL